MTERVAVQTSMSFEKRTLLVSILLPPLPLLSFILGGEPSVDPSPGKRVRRACSRSLSCVMDRGKYRIDMLFVFRFMK